MVSAKTLVTTYKGTQHQSPQDHNQITETVDGPYVIQKCQALARRTYILKETFCLSLSENYASPVQQTGWNVLYTSVFFCLLSNSEVTSGYVCFTFTVFYLTKNLYNPL
jgi:hypothetical protein